MMNSKFHKILSLTKQLARPIRLIKEYISLKKSSNFDAEFYISNYQDIQKFRRFPYLHYLFSGKYEVRPTSENYVSNFPQFEKYRYRCRISQRKAASGIKRFGEQPLMSVMCTIDAETDLRNFGETVQSIVNQYYKYIEISVAFMGISADRKKSVCALLDKTAIPYTYTNSGMEAALKNCCGEYIVFLRNGDLLTKDALFAAAWQINQQDVDLLFSDEDKQCDRNRFCDPYYKSEFSYDTFLSHNSIGYFAVVKAGLLESINQPFESGLGRAVYYNLYLKLIEKTDRIAHIQTVLYHKRIAEEVIEQEKSILQCVDSGYSTALKQHLNRVNRSADVSPGMIPGSYRIQYAIPGEPLVSIIIPFKDKIDILKTCVKSIREKTSYTNFEIIGVSNNSVEPETEAGVAMLEALDKRIKVYPYDIPFSYAKVNNYAADKLAKGEYIIFLNNDTEIITPNWVRGMLHFAARVDIGAVGPKMLYPNHTIQTAGVGLGVHGFIGEYHKFFNGNADGYFGRLKIDQNVRAVSAACMMVKREKFISVGLFDEECFAINFNDLDICFKFIERGWHNIFTPFVQLYHYESLSRAKGPTPLLARESEALRMRYDSWIQAGDPFYNKNLEQRMDNFSIKT